MLLQAVLSSFFIMAVNCGRRTPSISSSSSSAVSSTANIIIPAYGKVSGTLDEARLFAPNTVLTDFAAKGGLTEMDYAAGQLTVHQSGYYFVYGQVWFEPFVSAPWYNRVAICINGAPFILIQHGMDGRAAAGSLYSGDGVYLNVDDYISIKTVYKSNMWVSDKHSFFGAYKIN